jgi:hypothetical protein
VDAHQQRCEHAGEVAEALPTEFDPESLKTNLGLCCRLLQWTLLDTSCALEALKASQTSKLRIANYIVSCEKHERPRACLRWQWLSAN